MIQSKRPRLEDFGDTITKPAIQEFNEEITKPTLAAMPQLSKDDGGTGGNGGQDVGNIYQSNDLQSYKVQDTVKDECELNDIFIDRLKKEAEKQFKGELLRTFFKKLSNYSEEVCVFFQLTQNIYLQ